MACHPLKMFEKRLLSSFRSVVLQDLVADHRADLLLITRPEAVGDLNTCLSEVRGKGTFYQNHLLLSAMVLVCHY